MDSMMSSYHTTYGNRIEFTCKLLAVQQSTEDKGIEIE